MNIISKIIKKLYYESSSERMIRYYRNKGIKIGEGTVILCPRDIIIDFSRPELVEIGKHVFLHKGTCILSHDWASWCFVEKYNDFIPSHGKIVIGDNVWLGENVTILKGVTIGSNVIIGIGSIVTKDVPSNSVAVGSPAHVICTLDDYYERRKRDFILEIVNYGKEIIKSGREPKEEDFYDDYPAFVDGRNFNKYDYPYNKIFSKVQFEEWKKHHNAQWNGFDDFLSEMKNR